MQATSHCLLLELIDPCGRRKPVYLYSSPLGHTLDVAQVAMLEIEARCAVSLFSSLYKGKTKL